MDEIFQISVLAIRANIIVDPLSVHCLLRQLNVCFSSSFQVYRGLLAA